MSLIKSISGIRGTIGGKVNDNLTPVDIVLFAAAYGTWLKNQSNKKHLTIIVGRDARISGDMVANLVSNTLVGIGINVVDIGLSTTPTVEMAVILDNADGGIIITASHNPKQWNALKLLNNKGEFLNHKEGAKIIEIADRSSFLFSEVDDLGCYVKRDGYINKHINEILNLELVDVDAIKKANFKVVVDAVNSTGGIAIPDLLDKLGVECIKLYCEPSGEFPHNPEPLKEHLTDLSKLVVDTNADLGVAVDPDVDRLAIVCEDGSMFGEEYTLVACADYVLSKTIGNTVSNLSSSKALLDVSDKYNCKYHSSAVGEVNVVELMKETSAVIGGEGNGGIIYPASHYGRDSLVGIALFLSFLAHSKKTCKLLRETYPNYFMSKDKIQLTPKINVDSILKTIAANYKYEDVITMDGVKINFDSEWVHLRKSNTEPIIRIYAESTSKSGAASLSNRFIEEIENLV